MSEDLRERVDALEETVAMLVEKDERKTERIEELEEENEELRERAEDAEETLEFLQESVWNLEDVVTGDTHDVATASMETEEKGGVLERVEDVEDEIEHTTSEAVDVDDAEDLLPIQQVARTPDANLNARERRAKFLWRDFKDYTERTTTGRVLSSTDAKRVLSAGEPDDGAATIDTTMIKRVFSVIKGGTRGAAKMRKKDGKWRLYVPDDWKEIAEEKDAGAAVNAVSGEA